MPAKDQIYSTYQEKVEAFQFDDAVASVFSDMIKRSVPGYEAIITMIGVFTQAHAKPDTHCYDLGCSLGASTIAILASLGAKNCHVIAIDKSVSMTQRCRQNLKQLNLDNNHNNYTYTVQCEDIREITFQPASVIVLNFTLQFIPVLERLPLLTKIYNALLPGGVLILSEKICAENSELNTLQTELHHAFKKAQGYSDLEISQKRSALDNVLVPESQETHESRLREAGFKQSQMWFQCLNFASFYAVK